MKGKRPRAACRPDDDFTLHVLEALDGRPFGAKELRVINLCNAAPALLEQLAHMVEYLRFHTAESGDWNAMLPEYEMVLAEAEAVLARIEGDSL